MATEPVTIAVLGAGSWGTALSLLLGRNGHRVQLWDHDPTLIEQLQAERRNLRYIPDQPFPDTIAPVAALEAALQGATALLIVVPSHAFREVLGQLRPQLAPAVPLAWATKGIEIDTGKLLHEVAAEELPEQGPPAVISGPTFAGEVAAGLPSAVTVASADAHNADTFAALLRSETFRTYTSTDVTGVELGGSMKNVLAIAAGISDGLGFGANARAALITRGLAELMRLGEAMGGRRETFMGLAGVGDLVLTCTDDQSRNRRLGLFLGRGDSMEQAQQEIGQVTEGVRTAAALQHLAAAYDVELPITDQVYRVLYQGLPADEAVRALLTRRPRAE